MIIRSGILLFLLLLGWQSLVFALQLPDYLLPSPIQVVESAMMNTALLLHETWPTCYETLLGFCLGILTGLIGGLLIASIPLVKRWVLPIMIISQAMPTFAIAPLLVLWFGYGLSAKIIITIIMIFFPVMSAFYDGLTNTPTPMLEVARIQGGSRFRTLYYIRIPAALPRLASGIRIAAVIAPMGAIIGEWVGSSQGLGYLMLTANARMEIDLMFAALGIVIIIALLLYFTVDSLLKKYIWWTI